MLNSLGFAFDLKAVRDRIQYGVQLQIATAMNDDYRENFYKECLKIDEAIKGTLSKDTATTSHDQPEIETGTYNGFDAVDQILMGL